MNRQLSVFHNAKIFHLLIALGTFICPTGHCFSQSKVVCHFNQLLVEDGLTSQTYNHHVFQDAQAFVWINSLNGLNRYDGAKIKQFKSTDRDSLTLLDDGLNSPFFETSRDALWFSSRQAIYSFSPITEEFSSFRLVPSSVDTVNDFQLKFIDQKNKLGWARIRHRLYVFPLENPERAYPVWQSPLVDYRSIFRTSTNEQQTILYSHAGLGFHVKILETDPAANEESPFRTFFKGKRVYCSLYKEPHTAWVGLRDGLGKVNIENLTAPIGADTLINEEIRDIVGLALLNDDTLIVATQKTGIYLYDQQTNQYIGKLYQHSDQGISAFQKEIEYIYLAPDSTLWISSQGNGVYFTHLSKVKFTSFFLADYEEEESAAGVKMVTQDHEGRTWGITEYKIFVWDSTGMPILDLYKSINSRFQPTRNKLFSIFCDEQNRIWLGSQAGLFLLDSASRRFQLLPLIHPELIRTPIITAFHQLSRDKLLISTAGNGIIELTWKNLIKNWSSAPWLKSNSTFNWIHQTGTGRLFANQYGERLLVLNNSTDRVVLKEIEHKIEYAGLVEDFKRKRLWIPSANGLFYIELDDPRYELQRDEYLDVKSIQGLAVDSLGMLWLSTSNGIARYNPDLDTLELRTYDIADGLQGLEFNFAAISKGRSGNLVFGGMNGVTIINPNDINDIKTPARPFISDIRIRGLLDSEIKDHNTAISNPAFIKNLVLDYKYNRSIAFAFGPKSYEAPDDISYHYQLIRNDRDTIDESDAQDPRFIDLRKGQYLLNVFAINSDEVSDNIPYRFRFRILAPWWQTWWFYTLIILVILGVIYFIYDDRIKKIRREEANRREKAETETAILRLQMNPHFLFNSINSIGGYIIDKEPGKAYHYLTRFAKLMRQILLLAAKPSLPLAEEIELMRQYLKVEQMRFEGKLNFEILTASNIEIEEVLVPTMLLQPFIENAIKHGLSNKEEGGRIRVQFELLETNRLQCIVEDNGIGREKAKSVNPDKSHKSQALEITKKRLQFLEMKTGQKTKLAIEDLHCHNGEAAGTRVTIHIPMIL